MGMRFLDADLLRDLTGHPVRQDYKQPDDPDVLPSADAFVVAPCTFNTINKLAAGISDTLALGLLNEGVGAGLPVILRLAQQQLAKHPAFPRSVEVLRESGVRFVLDPKAYPNRPPGARRLAFPWTPSTRNSPPSDVLVSRRPAGSHRRQVPCLGAR